jgi:hypothetical protein
MARFRLTPRVVPESDVQRQVTDYLISEVMRGRVGLFVRVNGGGMRDSRGVFFRFYRLWMVGLADASKGYGDIHGVLGPRSPAPGRYFMIEVKRQGPDTTKKKRAEDQGAVIAAVLASGGIAGRVTSFEEAKRLLFGE